MTSQQVGDGFHERNGWFFRRLEDGHVRIIVGHPEVVSFTPEGNGRCGLGHDIGPDAWASIVASVSADGETSERFYEARKFHGDAE